MRSSLNIVIDRGARISHSCQTFFSGFRYLTDLYTITFDVNKALSYLKYTTKHTAVFQ